MWFTRLRRGVHRTETKGRLTYLDMAWSKHTVDRDVIHWVAKEFGT